MRHFATASALLLLLASPAYARDTAPAPAVPSELEQSGLTPPTVLSEGYAADDRDVLVTKLLGQKVYTSVADNAREVGAINNMVITSGMGISAVVIGVGGFLGIGEKDVAVDFAELTLGRARRWHPPLGAQKPPRRSWPRPLPSSGPTARIPPESPLSPPSRSKTSWWTAIPTPARSPPP
ncbi:PRC-barrel domain-containing protein [Devosia sp. A8/3-2]|nr:PRC-barrel domain-containing protein [Devosia sp. A8/3-2]